MSDLLLLLLVGEIWTLVVILVVKGIRNGISYAFFYFIGNAVSTGCLLLCTLLTGGGLEKINQPGQWAVLGCFVLGSLLNGSAQAVTMYNLRSGGSALTASIPQISFLLPFICGMIFWDEPVTVRRISGVLIIALSVCALAASRNDTRKNANWNAGKLLLALFSALLMGCSQLAVIMAGYMWPENTLPNMTRTFYFMLSATVFFGIISASELKKSGPPPRKSLKWAFFWGIVATVSNLLLFYCVERFSRLNQSAVVYAAGSAVMMVSFTLYSRFCLKEKTGSFKYCCLAGLIAGLLLCRLGV